MPSLAHNWVDRVRSDSRGHRGFGWSVLPLACRPGSQQEIAPEVANDDLPRLRLIGEISLVSEAEPVDNKQRLANVAVTPMAAGSDERDLVAFGMLACLLTMVLSASGLVALAGHLF
jgi:hypothetical protein